MMKYAGGRFSNECNDLSLNTGHQASSHTNDHWVFRPIALCLTDKWWRYQMGTFPALPAICAWNSPVTREFHEQRPVTRRFDVFFYLRLNKRLNTQWCNGWFETTSRPLWRHCIGLVSVHKTRSHKPVHRNDMSFTHWTIWNLIPDGWNHTN